MISYEIVMADPLQGNFSVVYSRDGGPDYQFSQAMPPEWTEELLHQIARDCVVHAISYWEHFDATQNVVVELSETSGQVKSRVYLEAPAYDPSTEKLVEQITEDDTTVTVAYIVEPLTEEEAAALARSKRDRLLRSTDLYGLADINAPQAILDYRQALRDVPQQEGFPWTIVWPIKPLEG